VWEGSSTNADDAPAHRARARAVEAPTYNGSMGGLLWTLWSLAFSTKAHFEGRAALLSPFVLTAARMRLCRPRAAALPFRVTDDGRVMLRSGKQLRLSPSAVASFEQCPLLFRRRHVERIAEPLTPQLAAGNLIHETLAELYSLPPDARTLDAAQGLFREAWRRQRRTPRYAPLFSLTADATADNADAGVGPPRARAHADIEAERAWGLRAFEALRAYFRVENPAHLAPLGCERRVTAQIASAVPAAAPIPITGTIDRLDPSAAPASARVHVVDYKTGRPPPERFREDAFFQLQVYALLLHERGQRVGSLRLLFLGAGGDVLERSVGEADLDATRARLREVWVRVLAAFREDRFEATKGRMCEWCAHKADCPAFADADGGADRAAP
jgi:putative RecB family exonuclease